MKKSILNKEDFIEKSLLIHGNKYDYSNVEYINTSTKVCIICPEHGEFWQTPYVHAIKGCGCSKCAKEELGNSYRNDCNKVIEKFIKIHGDKYDYSLVKEDYINMHSNVRIICSKHGIFQQTPHNHLKGNGCLKCYLESKKCGNPNFRDEFIEKSKKIHNNKYEYIGEYFNRGTDVTIICPKHGEFKQKPREHLEGCGCPMCSNKLSKYENEIFEFVKGLCNDSVQRDRTIIKPYELDIYIPSKKIAIEYNGLLWHSEEFGKDKNYHLNKLNECQKQNIKLIQVFEDEFLLNKNLVLNKIRHIIFNTSEKTKIMGRKCIIKEIDNNTTMEFLNKFHIQGYSSSTIYLGAYYNNELIAVMTFKKENSDGNWELTRFASNYNYICQGVGGKLFKYFIRNYNPNEIKSFADRRWTIDEVNNIYLQLGFKFDKYIKPDYSYFKQSDGYIRQHKFNFRKKVLNKKYGLPISMTEDEMRKKLGYYKIWNCGLIKYIWKKYIT